jgi:hypothetical protein
MKGRAKKKKAAAVAAVPRSTGIGAPHGVRRPERDGVFTLQFWGVWSACKDRSPYDESNDDNDDNSNAESRRARDDHQSACYSGDGQDD